MFQGHLLLNYMTKCQSMSFLQWQKYNFCHLVIDKFCRHCNKAFGNVWKHEKTCRRKPKTASRPTDPEPLQPGAYLAKFKAYLVSQVGTRTARQWCNKSDVIFDHWTGAIDDFDAEKLLQPLHHSVLFPSLKSYIDSSEVVGDKLVAIKVYKYLAEFTINTFEERYWSWS